MYKFIPFSEYDAHFFEVDGQGNKTKVFTNPLRIKHPNARINSDKTEVVISCNDHSSGCNCLSHAEALKHIEEHWPDEPNETI